MTVDEEFEKLSDDFRRLKIEYEVYFNGGSPRPPSDTLYRVENTIRRYANELSKLNFSQRFRFTSLLQKHAVYSQLWRRKLREKEEGRTPGGSQRRAREVQVEKRRVRVVCSDPDTEVENVNQLLQAMQEAKREVGESLDGLNPATFHKFIKEKTQEMRARLGCTKVQYTVSVEGGKVRLRATIAE